MKLKKIYNRFVPFKGYTAITILVWMVIRSEYRESLPWFVEIHENIHLKQEIEMLFVLFYIWYGVEYLIKLAITGSASRAYNSVSFEQEAYRNQFERCYLERRRHYAWLKYVFKLKTI